MSLSNTAANLLIRSSAIVVQLALVPIAVTAVGKDIYGVWMAAMSVAMIATAFDFGTLNAVFNLAARSRSRRTAEVCALAASRRALLIALVVYGVIAAVVFSVDVAALLNTEQSPAVARNLILLVCGISLLTLPFSVFNQLRLARLEAARIAPLLVAGNAAGFVAAWAAARAGVSPTMFVAASLMPALFAQAGVAIWGITRYAGLPLRSVATWLPRANQRVRRQGSPFFVAQIATLASFHVDNLIIAGMLSSSQAAEYALANRYFSIITIVLSVFLATAWPIYARLLVESNTTRLRKVFLRNLVLSVGFAAVCGVFLLLAHGPFFEHWTRAMVSPSLAVMLALAAFAVVNAALGNVSALLNAAGQISIQAKLAVVMMVPNILLSVLLVRHFGPAGTVIASAICCMVMLGVYLWHWKHLESRPDHE